MATMQDLIAEKQRRASQPAGVSMADLKAEKQRRTFSADRRFEESMMVPPAPGNTIVPAAKPQGYDERNIGTPSTQPSATDSALRSLQIGTQGVGRGMAGLAGLPVDLTEMVLNLGGSGIEGLINALGGNVDVPQFQGSVGSSEQLSTSAGDLIRAVAGEGALIPESDMSTSENMIYRANQLGTEGALGGGLLSRAAAARSGAAATRQPGAVSAPPDPAGPIPHALTAPYATGNVARTVAGDTAAGAGAGMSLGAYESTVQDSLPEWAQPIGGLVAALFGGAGGANLARVGDGVDAMAQSMAGTRNVSPDIIPPDELGLLTTRNTANRAAKTLQDRTYNVDDALRRMDETQAAIGEGPMPTLGLMTDDPGLLGAERRMRTTDAAPLFIANDRAVMNNVSDRVQSLRPRNGDPEALRQQTQSYVDEMLGAARRKETDATAAAAQQDDLLSSMAADVQTGRSANEASRDLDRVIVDDTYIPMREDKNRRYERAAEDPNVVIRTDNARAAADAQAANTARVNPALRDPASERISGAFRGPDGQRPTGETLPAEPGAQQPPVTRTLGEAMADRQALGRIESEARAAGEFGRADTARGIRKGINEDVRTAAESGVPGTEKLAEADKFYREQFAPYFREGGEDTKKFFKDVDRGTQRTGVPEATASKFLQAGPNGRQAAEDVRKIIEIAPDPAAGKAAVRDYAMADAVGKGLIDTNGKINENALARYIAKREGMFEALPELKAEFSKLLSDVRAGNAKANELATAMKQAATEAKLTEKQINEGALRLVMDYDNVPDAIGQILGRKDSIKELQKVREAIGNNPAAQEGLKAAVADHFVKAVTNASKAGVTDDATTVSLPKLARQFDANEKAMAGVFSPDEMSALRQARTRLETLSKRGAQASSGSASAENVGGVGDIVRAFAGPVGTITLLRRGALMAGSVERRIKAVADQFPNNSRAVNDLIARAMFDPKVAKHLLEMPTTDTQINTWNSKLNRLLGYGAAQSAAADEGEDE